MTGSAWAGSTRWIVATPLLAVHADLTRCGRVGVHEAAHARTSFLFVPNEATFHAALSRSPALPEEALRQRVVTITDWRHPIARHYVAIASMCGASTSESHVSTARTLRGTRRPWVCSNVTGIGAHVSSGNTSTRVPTASVMRRPAFGT